MPAPGAEEGGREREIQRKRPVLGAEVGVPSESLGPVSTEFTRVHFHFIKKIYIREGTWRELQTPDPKPHPRGGIQRCAGRAAPLSGERWGQEGSCTPGAVGPGPGVSLGSSRLSRSRSGCCPAPFVSGRQGGPCVTVGQAGAGALGVGGREGDQDHPGAPVLPLDTPGGFLLHKQLQVHRRWAEDSGAESWRSVSPERVLASAA